MIHYIKLSCKAKYLIAAEFEKTIHVWDFLNKRKLYTIKTSFDTSRERFAISNDETAFVSCLWSRKSIILHNLSDGSKIWENKLINHIDFLTFSSDDKFIYVETEHYFYVLDSNDGNIIKKEKGDCKRSDSHYNNYSIIIKNKKYDIYLDNNKFMSIPLKSFSYLDLCFGINNFYVSEVGGELRCINLHNGEELWSFLPEFGKHFTRICYNKDYDIVFGVLYPYQESNDDVIYLFNSENGEIINIIYLNDRFLACSFIRNGEILVTINGDIYNFDKEKSMVLVDKLELHKK